VSGDALLQRDLDSEEGVVSSLGPRGPDKHLLRELA